MSKHSLLTDWLKERIEGGEFEAGKRILSENELCAIFGISRQTVRQAIASLEREGYLERRRGSGTYVSRRRLSEPVKNIAFLCGDPGDPELGPFLRGIDSVLSGSVYAIQLYFTYNRTENESKILQDLLRLRIAGLVAEPAKSALFSPNRELYERFANEGVPCLFALASLPALPIPGVAADNLEAGKLAVKHAVSKNHRHIGAVFPSDLLPAHLRYYGYINALNETGRPVDEDAVLWYALEDAERLFSGGMDDFVLQKLGKCTAVVCYSDSVALSLISLLERNGKKVPEDLSVIGFGDTPYSRLSKPGLTTVATDAEGAGKAAAINILRLIKDPSFDANAQLPPRLVIRDSVKAL
jgi:GntR family transcriptional regulator of arabinose operon